MIYAFVVAFVVLLRLNQLVFKSPMAPTTLFIATWTGALLGIGLCGDLFLPISSQALLIYLVGATAFTLGGMFAGQATCRLAQRPKVAMNVDRRRYCRLILDFLLVVTICGLPFYAHYMLDPVGGLANPNAIWEIRQRTVESSGQATTFNLVNNLSVLSRFGVFGMFFETDGGRSRNLRAYFSLAPAFAYGILSGSKGPVIIVLLTAMFLSWIKSDHLSVRKVLTTAIISLAFFSFGLLYINYAFVTFSSASDTGSRVGLSILHYTLGGPVAFDRIARDPNSMPSTQKPNRFFLETANSLGGHFEVPGLHAQYSDISGGDIDTDTNVYTIYFSYYKDYGWLGTVGLMAFVGFCLTLLYNAALRSCPVFSILWAMTSLATFSSIFAEHYFLGLNEYIKAVIFFTALYHAPMVRLKERRTFPSPRLAAFNS
jgi:oligosaccharide repeat unit polymerase